EVEVDQLAERFAGRGSVGDHGLTAFEQPAADSDQQFDQQGFLVWEVPVHRGPADADGRAQIVEAHAEEAAVGDEPGAGIEQLPPALGFLLFTAREHAGFRAGHRRSSQPVWTTRLVKINLYSSYQRLTDRQDGVM